MRFTHVLSTLMVVFALTFPVAGADQLDFTTGVVCLESPDIQIPGKPPVTITRYYRSSDHEENPFGRGWKAFWDIRLYRDFDNCLVLREFGDQLRSSIWTIFRPANRPVLDLAAELKSITPEPSKAHRDYIQIDALLADGPGRVSLFEQVVATKRYAPAVFKEGENWFANGTRITRTKTGFHMSGPGRRYEFDEKGRMSAWYVPATRTTCTIKRNALGNVISVLENRDECLSLVYDSAKNIVEIRNDCTLIWNGFYNNSGFLTREETRAKSYRYRPDDKGRMIHVEMPGRKIGFLYDEADRMQELVSNGRTVGKAVATQGSDSLVLDLWQAGPDGKLPDAPVVRMTTVFGVNKGFPFVARHERDEGGSGPTRFEFDEDGNLTRESRRNEFCENTYDERGNLLEERSSDGATSVFCYATSSGKLSSLKLPDRAATFTYSHDGKLTRVEHSASGTLTLSYAPQGRLATATLSDGITLTCLYDPKKEAMAKSAGQLRLNGDAWSFRLNGKEEGVIMRNPDGEIVKILAADGCSEEGAKRIFQTYERIQALVMPSGMIFGNAESW